MKAFIFFLSTFMVFSAHARYNFAPSNYVEEVQYLNPVCTPEVGNTCNESDTQIMIMNTSLQLDSHSKNGNTDVYKFNATEMTRWYTGATFTNVKEISVSVSNNKEKEANKDASIEITQADGNSMGAIVRNLKGNCSAIADAKILSCSSALSSGNGLWVVFHIQ